MPTETVTPTDPFTSVLGDRRGGPWLSLDQVEALVDEAAESLYYPNPGYNSSEERHNWNISSLQEAIDDRLNALRTRS